MKSLYNKEGCLGHSPKTRKERVKEMAIADQMKSLAHEIQEEHQERQEFVQQLHRKDKERAGEMEQALRDLRDNWKRAARDLWNQRRKEEKARVEEARQETKDRSEGVKNRLQEAEKARLRAASQTRSHCRKEGEARRLEVKRGSEAVAKMLHHFRQELQQACRAWSEISARVRTKGLTGSSGSTSTRNGRASECGRTLEIRGMAPESCGGATATAGIVHGGRGKEGETAPVTLKKGQHKKGMH